MRYASKLAVTCLLSGIVIVGCTSAEAPSSNLAPTGTLRAVFLGSNPVQGRVDAQTGVASGTVPDLVQELADGLDLPYTLASAPNARGVMDSLINAEADIGFLAYSDSRALEVDYAAPYLVMFSSYLVPTDSAIETGADVDLSGVRVGAVRGQSQELFVSSALKNAEILYFETVPSQAELEMILTNGDVDAFAINRQRSIDAQEASDSRLRVLPDSFMEVEQSIVVPKGDTAKLEAIKAFVAQVQASEFIASSIERAGLIGVAAPYEGTQ
jgi:polar amino acid transport system substrate-binding protein